MSKPRQSILSIYYTFLIFIFVIFIIMFGTIFNSQYSKLRGFKESEKLINISTELFFAVKSFGFERGRINVVLNYKGAASDKLSDIAFLEKHRQTGEAAVTEALGQIERLNMPGVAQQVNALRQIRDTVNSNRMKAESEIAKDYSERDTAFPAKWFSDISDYINSLAMLAVRFNMMVQDMGIAGKSYLQLLENATLLRDNAGPVCSYTASAINSPEKFDDTQDDEIHLRYSKAGDNLYRMKLAAHQLNNEEITNAMHDLENIYFSRLQRAIDSTMSSLKNSAPFEYSQKELTDLAVGALNSIVKVVELAENGLTDHLNQQMKDRYSTIAAYAVICAVTLMFFINFIYLLNKKIHTPTKAIISKLRKLSEGNTDIEIEEPKYNDEIADMMNAVISFRDALVQISESKDQLEKTVSERTEELYEKAAEMEMILNNIPVLIFFKDTQNNIIKSNRAAKNVLGLDPYSELPVKAYDVFPGCYEKFYKYDLEIIESGKAKYNIFCKVNLGEKEDRDFNISKIPVLSKDGKIENILTVISDVTELSKAQDENKKSYKLLAQQSKMAEIGSMIGVISHQLKQPLNVISLLVESLDNDEEELEYARKTIRDTVMFMAGTIDDFLNFFRPSKHPETFYLSSVVEEVYSLIQRQFEKDGIKLEVVNDTPLALTGYKNEMKQVVLNIMNNSRDAFISKKVTEKRVRIIYDITDEQAVVNICDNAGGIPEDLLPDRIFELYSSTKGSGGNGIGLFICKNILEEHMNASIEAFNTGEGACFRITFRQFSRDI